jgi:hypothetical protein
VPAIGKPVRLLTAVLVVLSCWQAPVYATMTGTESEILGRLPKYIKVPSTVTVTLTISQSTPYQLMCSPIVTFEVFVPNGTATDVTVDVSARFRDPSGGQWVKGAQDDYPYSSGEQVDFTFTTYSFTLDPGQKLVTTFEFTYGDDAPVGWYIPLIFASCTAPEDPGESVNVETVGEGDQQGSQVGGPVPSTQPPPPPHAGSTPTHSTGHATHAASPPALPSPSVVPSPSPSVIASASRLDVRPQTLPASANWSSRVWLLAAGLVLLLAVIAWVQVLRGRRRSL